MADRNAERTQFVGQFTVLIDRQADVLGGVNVFNVVLDGLIFSVEQFLDCLVFAVGSAKEPGDTTKWASIVSSAILSARYLLITWRSGGES